jgi:glutamate-ammonia-ligase adenylyltransferase
VDLSAALGYSRYAERALAAQPALVEALEASVGQPFDWAPAEQAIELAAAQSPSALASALRRLRTRVFLHTMARDLTGRASLDEVLQAVTRLAEVAIPAAVATHARALGEAHGQPIGAQSGAPQALVVIGMGKLGGSELNVSSDIDLVFAFPEDGVTDGARSIANAEFFERLGRRVIGALHEVTVDGYVFRVDMRLRPYGDSGPLCASYGALEQYLVAQGRAWERYAWLKARPLCGTHHRELAALVEPFVYRKYLDYDAYEGLRGIHRQIRAQEKRADYERDIKLGRGGIREIEFVVQALQIVRGGREPSLRVRGTRAAIAALEARGVLTPQTSIELSRAYAFLRNLEHRLQYRDDRQTQRLPDDADELLRLAAAFDLADDAALLRLIARERRSVAAQFDAVFGPAEHGDDATEELVTAWEEPQASAATLKALAAAGYDDPDALAAMLRQTHDSARYAQLPALSRQRFDELVPRLLAVAARERVPAATPQVVFARLLALLEAVSRRSAYLALLIEHPPILPRLAQLMGASAWAADYLTQHPVLLDELLDARTLLAEPDWQAWRDELDRLITMHRADTEHQLDALRHFRHTQALRLLAQDLAGLLTIERLADHLSALADVILDATVRECWRQLCEAAGRTAGPPRFAVIAYGRLGGKELGYASDLDLVFLYEAGSDDPDADSAGDRYARLAQRVNAWLTSTTAAGQLYDTDLRLRPDGLAGLMVSSLEHFRRYQREQAWTWEHQALTRARAAAGDASLGAAFEAERVAILRMPRDEAHLAREIVAMRRRMANAHPNASGAFDLKHDEGGMIDIEFVVQHLVLAHAHAHAELTENRGNIALLQRAGELGLVPAERAQRAADAYREYRRLQHQIRLTGARQARVDPAAVAQQRATVMALWRDVFGLSWASAAATDGTSGPGDGVPAGGRRGPIG